MKLELVGSLLFMWVVVAVGCVMASHRQQPLPLLCLKSVKANQ